MPDKSCETPKITVIIPVYNAEKYLQECLKSVLNQTLKEIEIICINDGSTDKSKIILTQTSKTDKRLRVVNKRKNEGLSAARNRGIRMATGKYVVFIDSDDYIDEKTLSKLFLIAEKESLDVLGFALKEIGALREARKVVQKPLEKSHLVSNKCITGKRYLTQSVAKHAIFAVSCLYLYRRRFLKKNYLAFEEGILHEDVLFHFQAMMCAERVKTIPDELYFYRRHKKSITLSGMNAIERIDSLCYIVNVLFQEQQKYNDKKTRKMISDYASMVLRSVVDVYKMIDSFPKNHVFRHREAENILSIVSAGMYNGFFVRKLPAEMMLTIRSANMVIIYGAGRVGQGLFDLLKERGITNILFAVTKRTGVRERNVMEIQDYSGEKDGVVVLIASTYEKEKMVRQAKQAGFQNILLPPIT